MRRFFGRDEEDDTAPGPAGVDEAAGIEPPEPERAEAPPRPEPAPAWDLDLTPALRQTPRQPAPAEPAATDMPTQGPAAMAARLDMLQSTMRAFRDTVATRLGDYGTALSRLTDADETAARRLAKVQEDFTALSAAMSATTDRVGSLVDRLEAAGLAAVAADMASHRAMAEAQAGELQSAMGALATQLHGEVAALSARLDGIELSITGVGQELQSLKRRMPVVRRGPESPPPAAPSEGRRPRR